MIKDVGDENPEEVVYAEKVRGGIEKKSREGLVAFTHVYHLNCLFKLLLSYDDGAE